MTKRWQTWALVGAIALGGFFEQGCSAFVQEKTKDALDAGRAWLMAEGPKLINSVKEKALAAVDAKLEEKEKKELATLDAQLAEVAKEDPETGVKQSKIWKDFDGDRDGQLSPGELVKATIYINAQAFARVREGKMTFDRAKEIGVNSGATAGILAALYGASKLRRRKQPPAKAPGGGPPPDPIAVPTAPAPTTAG